LKEALDPILLHIIEVRWRHRYRADVAVRYGGCPGWVEFEGDGPRSRRRPDGPARTTTEIPERVEAIGYTSH
jgi:hypothetical protein